MLVGLLVWGLTQCGKLTSGDHNSNAPPRQTQTLPANTTPNAPPSEAPAQPSVIRYVTASSLNLRQTPDTTGAKITTLPSGTALQVFESRGQWLRVSAGGGEQGWVHGDFTSTAPPVTPHVAPKPAQVAPSQIEDSRPRSEIVRLIIEGSVNSYSGSCPCPYNVDRAGRRCGGRSAYSRPGGASPICYEGDVTEAMIRAFQD
ncbi:SH3 domain-containing protein [Devosia sp. SL43]|nr:SH3 domain-containing protein [Devosia sp. SL43]